MKKRYEINEDGIIPIITNDIKVVYSKNEINTNLLLNKVLGTRNLQITQIDDLQLSNFLTILNESKLMMPDGTDSLMWLKKRISKRFDQSLTQRGQTWEDISRRYRFILEQIDVMLATR
jgi:hypothetical protein